MLGVEIYNINLFVCAVQPFIHYNKALQQGQPPTHPQMSVQGIFVDGHTYLFDLQSWQAHLVNFSVLCGTA